MTLKQINTNKNDHLTKKNYSGYKEMDRSNNIILSTKHTGSLEPRRYYAHTIHVR